MGGGLCWIDYDDDGWLDLFVVNAYSDDDYVRWTESGGLPRSALFHNVRGRFEDVSRGSGADLQLRGNGCVAADFNLDGHTDLYVTTAGYNVATNGYDALLWGHGDGTFTEGARKAGINTPGWHAGAAVGDVNGDGLPDLFVAGLRRYERPDPLVHRRLPGQPRRRARPPLPQPGPGRERPLPVPRGGKARRPRSDARRPRARSGLHGRERGRTARPLRRERPGPQPAVHERRSPGEGLRRARLPLRGARTPRGHRRPERRHGDRRGGLQPRRARGPLRDQLRAGSCTRSTAARAPTAGAACVRGRTPGLRRGPRQGATPVGVCRGPISISTATSTSSSRTERSRS